MVPADPRPAAVLLGGSENALSAARSLARRGVAVDALGDGLGRSPVRHSRAVRAWASPSGDVQDWWAEQLRARRPSVVIPCCDDAVELVAHRRADLEAHGHLVPPGDDDVLLAMLDKAATARAAERADVPAPAVATVSGGLDDLREAAERIGFPCGIKPLASHRFTRRSGGSKGATVADERALLEVGQQMLDAGVDLLVTEIVPGADPVFCSYNTYVDDDGTHLFEITKEKLRQHPIDFGRGTFHRTVHLPDVVELGRRFIRTTGVRGFGNVEFRRDARDGQLKLIECNVRLTAANELLRRAGCDVAWVVYRRAIGEEVEPIDGFEEDVRVWYPIRDLRAALDYRRAGQLPARRWLRDVVPLPDLPMLSARDPWPSVATAASRLWRRRRPATV